MSSPAIMLYREYKQILFHTTSFYSITALLTILQIFVAQIILAIKVLTDLGFYVWPREESSILYFDFNIWKHHTTQQESQKISRNARSDFHIS